MWCSIHKWKISRAVDSGKPLAGRTQRHLRRCVSCREFAEGCKEMGWCLSEDAAMLIGDAAGAALGEKVQAALGGRIRAEAPVPSRPIIARWRPILAAAASLIVVGVSVVWLVTSRPRQMPRLDPLFSFESPQVYLESAAQRAESPYQEEIVELEKALKSTADFVRARFDIGLGD
jgi:hypothetical protein